MTENRSISARVALKLHYCLIKTCLCQSCVKILCQTLDFSSFNFSRTGPVTYYRGSRSAGGGAPPSAAPAAGAAGVWLSPGVPDELCAGVLWFPLEPGWFLEPLRLW